MPNSPDRAAADSAGPVAIAVALTAIFPTSAYASLGADGKIAHGSALVLSLLVLILQTLAADRPAGADVPRQIANTTLAASVIAATWMALDLVSGDLAAWMAVVALAAVALVRARLVQSRP